MIRRSSSYIWLGFLRSCCLLVCCSLLQACLHINDVKYYGRQLLTDTALIDQYEVQRQRRFVLPISSSIYTSVPQLGGVAEGDRSAAEYYMSYIAESTQQAFLKRFAISVVGVKAENLDRAMNTASEQGYRYMVYPSLIDWQQERFVFLDEQGPSKFDRVTISMRIFDVRSQELIDVVSIASKNGILTFANNSADQLLDKALYKMVDTYAAK